MPNFKLQDVRQLQQTMPNLWGNLWGNLCLITNKNSQELNKAILEGEIEETILLHHKICKLLIQDK